MSRIRLPAWPLLAALSLAVIPADARILERASLPSDPLLLGRQADADSDSVPLGVSDDGRFVVFASYASNLVAGDRNPDRDVYLLDRNDGSLQRVPEAPASPLQWGSSSGPLISGDGRIVVFHSERPDLAADGVRRGGLYAWDRLSGAIDAVSVADDGSPANEEVYLGGVSRDGRYVVFSTMASNLVAGDGNSRFDVFLRDRVAATTRRISVTDAGTEALGHSVDPAISADGRHVCFHTNAAALVPGGSASGYQVIRVELAPAGAIVSRTLISRTATGTPAGPDSFGCRIAADSLDVAFVSAASDLVEGANDSAGHAYVFDHASEQVSRVSLVDDGSPVDRYTQVAAISADGRRIGMLAEGSNLPGGDVDDEAGAPLVFDRDSGTSVQLGRALDGRTRVAWSLAFDADGARAVFSSPAIDLVAGDTNFSDDVFVQATGGGAIERISLAPQAVPAGAGGREGAVSADGRYVVFASSAPVFVLSHQAPRWTSQIYRFDRVSRQTELVSRAADGSPASGSCMAPRVSADGRRVSFACTANNLPGADAGGRQLYLRDLQAQTTTLVSRAAGGGGADHPVSTAHSLAADGSHVAFVTAATNLGIAGTTVARPRLFVWARADGSLVRADVPAVGDNEAGAASLPSLSADGRRVAFTSTSDVLHPDDPNIRSDVFVKDLDDGSLHLVSRTPGGAAGNGSSLQPTLSADGDVVAFVSTSSDLVAGDDNGVQDVFVHRLDAGITQRVVVAVPGAVGGPFAPSLSADGRFVAFSMLLPMAIQGFGSVRADAFVYDLGSGRLQRASRDRRYRPLEVGTFEPELSADGRFVVFGVDPGMGVDIPGRPAAPFGSDVVIAENPLGDHVFADGLEP